MAVNKRVANTCIRSGHSQVFFIINMLSTLPNFYGIHGCGAGRSWKNLEDKFLSCLGEWLALEMAATSKVPGLQILCNNFVFQEFS